MNPPRIGEGPTVTRCASAIEIARAHVAEAARKAAEKRVKRLKCSGCGAILDDASAFQARRLVGSPPSIHRR